MTTHNIPFVNSSRNQEHESLIDIPIDEHNLDVIRNSINSNNNNSNSNSSNIIRGILKKPPSESDIFQRSFEIKQMAKQLTIITFMLIYFPIIGLNLWFAFTDFSCINTSNSFIQLNLYDYLVVDSITLLTTLISIILSIIYDPQDHSILKHLYDGYIMCYKLFSLIWLTLGAVIFWLLIDSFRSCSYNVYYYLTVVIIIRIAIHAFYILVHYKQRHVIFNIQ
jgi:hypothetical protein